MEPPPPPPADGDADGDGDGDGDPVEAAVAAAREAVAFLEDSTLRAETEGMFAEELLQRGFPEAASQAKANEATCHGVAKLVRAEVDKHRAALEALAAEGA